MFVSEIQYAHYPDLTDKKSKSDYIAYFKDMQHFACAHLDESMLMQKNGYSFLSLMNKMIQDNPLVLPLLQRADICVLISDSYDFDSEYTHVGSALVDQYNLRANLLDVADQGNLCLISALHILKVFFSQQTMHHALVIGFEQRVLPIRKNNAQLLPDFNGVGVMALSSQAATCEIIESDIVVKNNWESKIRALEKNQIVYCYLLTQRTDYVIPSLMSRFKFSIIQISPGILPLFIFFERLKKEMLYHEKNALYAVFIEENESGERGVIVMRRGEIDSHYSV